MTKKSEPRRTNRGALRLSELFPAYGAQPTIAKRVGVKQAVVSRWMSGKRRPDAKRRGILEKEFGIGWALWDEDVLLHVTTRAVRAQAGRPRSVAV